MFISFTTNKKQTIAYWARLLITYSSEIIPLNSDTSLRSQLKNSCFVFHQGFQTPRNNKSTPPSASYFHPFLGVWNPWWKTRTRFWSITYTPLCSVWTPPVKNNGNTMLRQDCPKWWVKFVCVVRRVDMRNLEWNLDHCIQAKLNRFSEGFSQLLCKFLFR